MLNFDDLGLGEPQPTQTTEPPPPTRPLLGIDEARAAGVSEAVIQRVGRDALIHLYEGEPMPFPVRLLIASEAPIETLIPKRWEQDALELAWFRLVSLLEQGVDEATAIVEAVDPPRVYITGPFEGQWDREKNISGDILEGTVHVLGGNGGSGLETKIAARRYAMRRDLGSPTGWRSFGYMVDQKVVEARGWRGDAFA